MSDSKQANQAIIECLATPVALKHVEPPEEKIVLPTAEDINIEKQHITFVNNVEQFDKNKLKPTVTKEKFILPDQEGFFLEKNLNI